MNVKISNKKTFYMHPMSIELVDDSLKVLFVTLIAYLIQRGIFGSFRSFREIYMQIVFVIIGLAVYHLIVKRLIEFKPNSIERFYNDYFAKKPQDDE